MLPSIPPSIDASTPASTLPSSGAMSASVAPPSSTGMPLS
jgi:hypothetical protein